MCILDVLKYDIENVAGIVRLLNDRTCIGWRNFRDRDFSNEEVVSALHDLVRGNMVIVLREESDALVRINIPKYFTDIAGSLWFKIRKSGLEALNRWNPPMDPAEQAFVRYVGISDFHDATVMRVDVSEKKVEVVVRAFDGREYAVVFDGVDEVQMHAPEGMMLYSVSEFQTKPPLRKFVFTNWEENDARFLNIVARDFCIR
jgi:hypothetical protein